MNKKEYGRVRQEDTGKTVIVSPHWDLDLEDRNPLFCTTLPPTKMHYNAKFAHKRLSSSKDTIQTNTLLLLCSLCPWLWTQHSSIFTGHWLMSCENAGMLYSQNWVWWCIIHQTQFCYKRLSSSEDILWTKPERWTDRQGASSVHPILCYRGSRTEQDTSTEESTDKTQHDVSKQDGIRHTQQSWTE